MKGKLHFHLPALSVLILVLALSGCGGGGENKNPQDTLPPRDTLVIDSVHHEGLFPATLAARMDQLCDSIFEGQFNRIKLEETDLTQHFPGEKETDYRRFVSLKAIKNSFGRGIQPRMTLRATRFADSTALRKNLEDWLNGMEHSGDKIVLGNNVEALKSPPFLCAVVDRDLFILKTACVYTGKEFDQLEALFFNLFRRRNASLMFRVTCEAGKLVVVK